MTFPTVESVTETSFNTQTIAHDLDYPASTSAGELLLLIFANEGNINQAVPSGYSTLAYDQFGNQVTTGIYLKSADGTEGGGSEPVSTSAAIAGAGQIYRISGWGGTIATDVDVSTVVEASGSSPSPGPVTAGWGADDNLFIAVVGYGDDDEGTDSAPANYTNLVATACGAGSNDSARVSTARRALASATDDPGSFTLTGTERYTAWTLVVKPSTGTGATLTDTFTLTWQIEPTWVTTFAASSPDGDLIAEIGAFSPGFQGVVIDPDQDLVISIDRVVYLDDESYGFRNTLSGDVVGNLSILQDEVAKGSRINGDFHTNAPMNGAVAGRHETMTDIISRSALMQGIANGRSVHW